MESIVLTTLNMTSARQPCDSTYQKTGLVKPSVKILAQALDRGAPASAGVHPVGVAADKPADGRARGRKVVAPTAFSTRQT